MIAMTLRERRLVVFISIWFDPFPFMRTAGYESREENGTDTCSSFHPLCLAVLREKVDIRWAGLLRTVGLPSVTIWCFFTLLSNAVCDKPSVFGGTSDTVRLLQRLLDDLPLVEVDHTLERLAAGLAQKRACQISMAFSNFETEKHAIHIDFIRIGDDGSVR